MIAAALFDIDGTLVDHDSAASAGIRSYIAALDNSVGLPNVEKAPELWLRLEEPYMNEYLSGPQHVHRATAPAGSCVSEGDALARARH